MFLCAFCAKHKLLYINSLRCKNLYFARLHEKIFIFNKVTFLNKEKNKKIIYVPLQRHDRTLVQKFLEPGKGYKGKPKKKASGIPDARTKGSQDKMPAISIHIHEVMRVHQR